MEQKPVLGDIHDTQPGELPAVAPAARLTLPAEVVEKPYFDGDDN